MQSVSLFPSYDPMYSGNRFDLISLHSVNILWRKWTLTACLPTEESSAPLFDLVCCARLQPPGRSTRPCMDPWYKSETDQALGCCSYGATEEPKILHID